MSDLCQIKDCFNFGKYWRYCGHKNTTEKPSNPIAKFSPKRKEINRKQYKPKALAFIKANPFCKLNLKGCTKKTQGVHHKKGKSTIELLLDERWWEPACNNCNLRAEIKDKESRSKNIKLSKFNDKATNE